MLTLPVAMAAGLTVLISLADQLHLRGQRIAGYGFAFGAPWSWLLDHGWFGDIHSRWFQTFAIYAVVLWIPALLYSLCLWLLFRVARIGKDLLARDC